MRKCGNKQLLRTDDVFVANGKETAIDDRDMCMVCGACMTNCAFGAISVNAGVGCATALINGIIAGGVPLCNCSGSKSKSGCR